MPHVPEFVCELELKGDPRGVTWLRYGIFKAPDQKAPGRAPAGLSQCQEETWYKRLANAQIDHE